jgi:hypothetical protein
VTVQDRKPTLGQSMLDVRMHGGREHMKHYQIRPSYVAASAWNRGYLKPLELLRIAAWKTGQGLGSMTVNTEYDIKRRTGAAMASTQHWKGRRVVGLTEQALWDDWRETARRAIGVAATRKGLLGLKGVGYPMATAILNILDPDVWPVIDRGRSSQCSEPNRTAFHGPLGIGSAPRPTRRTLGIWQLKVRNTGVPTTPSTSSMSKL